MHEARDPEYSILKQRLARRMRYEGTEEADVQRMDLVDMTKVRSLSNSSLDRDKQQSRPTAFGQSANSGQQHNRHGVPPQLGLNPRHQGVYIALCYPLAGIHPPNPGP